MWDFPAGHSIQWGLWMGERSREAGKERMNLSLPERLFIPLEIWVQSLNLEKDPQIIQSPPGIPPRATDLRPFIIALMSQKGCPKRQLKNAQRGSVLPLGALSIVPKKEESSVLLAPSCSCAWTWRNRNKEKMKRVMKDIFPLHKGWSLT